jgi:hypothetical protein
MVDVLIPGAPGACIFQGPGGKLGDFWQRTWINMEIYGKIMKLPWKLLETLLYILIHIVSVHVYLIHSYKCKGYV